MMKIAVTKFSHIRGFGSRMGVSNCFNTNRKMSKTRYIAYTVSDFSSSSYPCYMSRTTNKAIMSWWV